MRDKAWLRRLPVAAVCGLLVWAAVPAWTDSSAATPEASRDDVARPDDRRTSERLREGEELIGESGMFQLAGDRVVFVSERGRFTGLENLALERVGAVVRDTSTPTHWTIDAIVTEFQGSNYLLVQKAVISRRGAGDRP